MKESGEKEKSKPSKVATKKADKRERAREQARKIALTSVAVGAFALLCLGTLAFNLSQKRTQESEGQATELTFVDELIIEVGDSLPVYAEYIKSGEPKKGEISYLDLDGNPVSAEKLKVGQYKVFIDGDEVSLLKVVDTTRPDVSVRSLVVAEGTSYKAENFIEKCKDNSGGSCDYSFKEAEMANFRAVGNYDVVIIVRDQYSNSTEVTAKLVINRKMQNAADGGATSGNAEVDDPSGTTFTPNTDRNTDESDSEEENGGEIPNVPEDEDEGSSEEGE